MTRATDPSVTNRPRFVFGGREFTPEEVTAALSPFVSASRLARIEAVLDSRTYTVIPVLDGLLNAGNVNAVMRTAEALGFQQIHAVAGDKALKYSSRTSRGAEKWLEIWQWETTPACLSHLRARGYRLAAAHLTDDAVPIEHLDFTEPMALLFGNERDGLSDAALSSADVFFRLPMCGFMQSYNVSVAAALSLHQVYLQRIVRSGQQGDLAPDERSRLRATYMLRSVRRANEILHRFCESAE